MEDRINVRELKIGFNVHRLQENDDYYKKECDFVKAINEEMKVNPSLLAQIVGNPMKKHWLDEGEDKIVLSVIQWLGTPVGQGFLDKVNKMQFSKPATGDKAEV